MLYASAEEKRKFLSGEQKYLTLTFSDGTVITNDDIYFESMDITQSVFEGDMFRYGRCSSSEFNIRIIATQKRFIGLTVTPTITCGEFTRPLGEYIVESDKITSDHNYRDIVAYDKLKSVLSEDHADWHNNLTFPITLKNYRDSFFTHVGITQKSITLVNDDMLIARNFVADEFPGSSVLNYICEINAVMGFIDWDGDFKYVKFSDPSQALYPSDTLYPADDLYPRDWLAGRFVGGSENDYYIQSSLQYEDYTVKPVERVQIRHTENDVGVVIDISVGQQSEDANTYIIENNPLLYGKTTEELRPIATNFIGLAQYATYTPASFSTRGRLWYELGDMFNVVTRLGVINVIILDREMSGITALKDTYKAQGKEYYEEKANSTNYSIEVLKQRTNELVRTEGETRSLLTELDTDLQGTKTYFQSEIDQKPDSITLSVTNSTSSASITVGLDNGSSQSATIQMTGLVKFTDLSTAGSTTINGENISTGYLSADRISGGTIDSSKIKISQRETTYDSYLITEIGTETGTFDAPFIKFIVSNSTSSKEAGRIKLGYLEEEGPVGGDPTIVNAGLMIFSDYRINLETAGTSTGMGIRSRSIQSKSISSGTSVIIHANGTLGVSSSSRRYKFDIKPIGKELDPHKILDIEIVQFKFKPEYDDEESERYLKEVPGMIAEDVDEHYPIAADHSIDKDGNITVENWNERYLIPPMLALIQEQHKEIELLKEQNKKLELRLSRLEEIIKKFE